MKNLLLCALLCSPVCAQDPVPEEPAEEPAAVSTLTATSDFGAAKIRSYSTANIGYVVNDSVIRVSQAGRSFALQPTSQGLKILEVDGRTITGTIVLVDLDVMNTEGTAVEYSIEFEPAGPTVTAAQTSHDTIRDRIQEWRIKKPE